MLASPDIYAHRVQEPGRSVNFVTCHDGFTLNDLVSYDAKHNAANREGNRDGHEHNLSWNCGVEGPTDDPVVEALRLRQIKNFLAINLLALGTPMLLMGDEMRRSQQGNNNAWCQDNELSWLDWTLLERNAGLHRFVKLLIAFRQRRDVVKFEDGLPLPQILEQADMRWHGVRLDEPDWSWDSHTLAATVESLSGNYALHVAINAFWDPLCLALPEASYDPWRRVVDTARESPHDLELPGIPLVEDVVELVPRSLVLLVSANAAFFRA
jgi:glycogen operon protein